MDHQSVLLSFSAHSIDEHSTDLFLEKRQYDTIELSNGADGIFLHCELPSDALPGDLITLSATPITGREADYTAEAKLSAFHIEQGMVILNLKGVGKCEDYLLQLNLLGLHGVLKNFAEFNATIIDNSGNQAKQQPKTNPTPWIKRVRQFFPSVITVLLSGFAKF